MVEDVDGCAYNIIPLLNVTTQTLLKFIKYLKKNATDDECSHGYDLNGITILLSTI